MYVYNFVNPIIEEKSEQIQCGFIYIRSLEGSDPEKHKVDDGTRAGGVGVSVQYGKSFEKMRIIWRWMWLKFAQHCEYT